MMEDGPHLVGNYEYVFHRNALKVNLQDRTRYLFDQDRMLTDLSKDWSILFKLQIQTALKHLNDVLTPPVARNICIAYSE